MTEYVVFKDEQNVTATVVNGRITDKKVSFESVKIECANETALIETLVGIINEPRIKGFKKHATVDGTTVTIKEIKSKN